MTYYLAAYGIFWAVLFGYLLGLSSRQQKLNARAARLRERLAEKARGADGAGVSGKESR